MWRRRNAPPLALRHVLLIGLSVSLLIVVPFYVQHMSKPSASSGATHTGTPSNSKAIKRQRFLDVFQIIRTEILDHFADQGMPKESVNWYQRNLDHNVPGGKLNRGMSVVDSVEILKGGHLSDQDYLKAAILGWCVELLQAFFLVSDDIMDQSFTRRGQPCWFRLESVGNIAINDAFMLEAAIYHLLKTHFRPEPYYVDLLELFHETSYQTEMGQLIDLITAPEDHVDLSKFSLDKHRLIVIYKTAYYSFYLPVALAFRMCEIPTSYSIPSSPSPIDPYKLALDILIPLGEYFQIQDDFLDYAGTPEQIGKVGTDIIDNKCSWCINTALASASARQRQVLDENYGQKDTEKEGRVKAVFEELHLREKYAEYEDAAYGRITSLIAKVPETPQGATNVPVIKREVFMTFLEKIYKRTK